MINSFGFCCVNVLVHNARIRPPLTTHSIHLSIAMVQRLSYRGSKADL